MDDIIDTAAALCKAGADLKSVSAQQREAETVVEEELPEQEEVILTGKQ